MCKDRGHRNSYSECMKNVEATSFPRYFLLLGILDREMAVETSSRKKEPTWNYWGPMGRMHSLLKVERKEEAIGQRTGNHTVTTGNASYSSGTREGSKRPRKAHRERLKGAIGNYRGKHLAEHSGKDETYGGLLKKGKG